MRSSLPFETDVLLSAHTTLGVGGPARWFLRLTDDRALPELFSWADEIGVPVWVLGEGSNVLVSDAGFAGLVIRMGTGGMEIREDGDRISVRVRAGESWDSLVRRAAHAGWAGIECLSGIPGTVGAAPVQNIGAYGQELSETLSSVEVFDPGSSTFETLSREDCRFGYRTSRFKSEPAGRLVIVAVTLSLRRGPPAEARYPELADALRAFGRTPDVNEVRHAVLSIRLRKSMVLQPGDDNRRSAGSFFTNPVVESAVADQVREVAISQGWGLPPAFRQGDGTIKLSAAWLVERAGFGRGFGSGPAGLSTRHCLAVVNRGGARAADIVRLAAVVRRGVFARFGVMLSPEPRFVGFSASGDRVLQAVQDGQDPDSG